MKRLVSRLVSSLPVFITSVQVVRSLVIHAASRSPTTRICPPESTDDWNLDDTASELERALEVLGEVKIRDKFKLPRRSLLRLSIITFAFSFLTLFIQELLFIGRMQRVGKLSWEELQWRYFFEGFAITIALTLVVTCFSVFLFLVLDGEMIEHSNKSPGYKAVLLRDLNTAVRLRRVLNNSEKLKILSVHVKHEIDWCSDAVNALSPAFLTLGVLLTSYLLIIGDDEYQKIGGVAVVASVQIAVALRVYAMFRLTTLRLWQSIIEQSQQITVSDLKSPGG